MKITLQNKMGYFVTGAVVLGSLLVSSTAFAAGPGFDRGMGHMPGVRGTVSAISGNTLTVTSKGFGPNATATTYTVDATNAKVIKAGVASSVASIAVGDTVMAEGTVSGTSVTATKIRDGVGRLAAVASVIKGNGQPVIGGNVTAVNGSTLTVINKSNVTYTVDATSATIEKGGAVSSISSVVVGDNVVVQGSVNGTSVVATSVMNGGTSAAHPGFGGRAGGFFHKLFGFF